MRYNAITDYVLSLHLVYKVLAICHAIVVSVFRFD